MTRPEPQTALEARAGRRLPGVSARARRLAAGFTSAGALALAACTMIPDLLAGGETAEPSPYGAYLAGRWAASNQAPGEAARYYSEALERAPGDPMLAAEDRKSVV